MPHRSVTKPHAVVACGYKGAMKPHPYVVGDAADGGAAGNKPGMMPGLHCCMFTTMFELKGCWLAIELCRNTVQPL